MKGLGNLLKQAQKVQEDMQRIQEELASKKIEASSGGGMVTVEVNGKQEVLSIKIDPEVVNPDDKEMLEDLVLAAVNEAMHKSRDMLKDEMAKVSGGLNIPGLM